MHCCRKGPSRILEGFKSNIEVPFIKSSLIAAKSNNFIFFHGIDNRSFSNTMVSMVKKEQTQMIELNDELKIAQNSVTTQ